MSDEFLLSPGRGAVTKLFGKSWLPRDGHAGLVFERYLRIWKDKLTDPHRTEKLLGPLAFFAQDFNGRQNISSSHPAASLLTTVHRRLSRIAPIAIHRQVAWRLVTGLGASHPTENGFTFDSVIGIPVLAGSIVKGLCRRAAEMEELDESHSKELFGPKEILAAIGETSEAGDIIFLDAYPTHWPKLCVDIVNCHHPRYYLYNGEREPDQKSPDPIETESPIPVFFLTVDQDTEFAFRLLSRSKNKENEKKALELLDLGLRDLGIGAKTAVGYGIFK